PTMPRSISTPTAAAARGSTSPPIRWRACSSIGTTPGVRPASTGRLHSSPMPRATPTSPPAPGRAASAPGPATRASPSKAAQPWKPRCGPSWSGSGSIRTTRPRRTPPSRSRARSTGAGTGSAPSGWNCGPPRAHGCTTAPSGGGRSRRHPGHGKPGDSSRNRPETGFFTPPFGGAQDAPPPLPMLEPALGNQRGAEVILTKVRSQLAAAEVEAVLAVIAQKLDGLGIESRPEVAMRMLELVGDDSAGLNDFAEALKPDIAMTGRLLKIANSAYFGQRQPVTTLERACVIL